MFLAMKVQENDVIHSEKICSLCKLLEVMTWADALNAGYWVGGRMGFTKFINTLLRCMSTA